MSSADVYAKVSPSITFVATPAGTGSGILVEGGYVVTNHHVVWPYEAVRVVFPDGAEFQDVPVVGWRPVADLAVVGPVEVSARPLTLEDGEGMALGEEVLQVGYPLEFELTPKPTVTRGILSRFREWERHGITLLQTDAVIVGGQSGGALVDTEGRVIGITTFASSDFGLALSASDISPTVRGLIEDGGHSERLSRSASGALEFNLDLKHIWDIRSFAFDALAGATVEVEIQGPGDGMISVSGPPGLLIGEDATETGVEKAVVEIPTDGPHFLQIELAAGDPSVFSLLSDVELIPLVDPDDGLPIEIGQTIVGVVDYPSDADWYSIHLREDETVRISTDSITVDTVVFVNGADDWLESFEFDDDSGEGLFGFNAELVYQAPRTGEFLIAVAEVWGEQVGGYYLTVERVSDSG